MRISPSSLKLLRECPRKWAFRYIEKVEALDNPYVKRAKEAGERMHAILQQARKASKLPDMTNPEAVVASAAIAYWPSDVDWKPEVYVSVYLDSEGRVMSGKNPKSEGVTFFGYSDMLGPCFVGDYKFTGNRNNLPGHAPYWHNNFKKRGKMSEIRLIEDARSVLLEDPQWIIYGSAASVRASPRDIVYGIWPYVIKPPKMEGQAHVIPVTLKSSAGDLHRKLKVLEKEALCAKHLRNNFKVANDVPHNADAACGGVGLDCEYAKHCSIV